MFSKKWMKKETRTRLARLLVAALPVTLAACGAAEPNDPYIVSSGGSSTSYTNSCVPITQQIPFSFSGGYLEYYVTRGLVMAGAIPASTTYGVVRVGGAATAGTFMGVGGYNLDSSVSLGITNTTSSTTPSAVTTSNGATGTGVLTIGAYTQQLITYAVQSGAVQISGLSTANTSTYWGSTSGMTYPTTTTLSASQICVSGVAFDLDIANYQLGLGTVYLYLNNSTHGVEIPF